MSISRYQVYGERCCGTNFVIRLLERNVTSASFTEAFGFKHWFVSEDLVLPDDTLAIVVTRDLVESLQSLHRQPWHVAPSLEGLDFSDFLRAEWHCVWDDRFWGVDESDPRWQTEMMHERDPATGERFANVVRMRAAKERNWQALIDRSSQGEVVRYDRVRQNPEAFLTTLAERYALELDPIYHPIDTYKGEADAPYQPKVYPEISDTDRAFIEREFQA